MINKIHSGYQVGWIIILFAIDRSNFFNVPNAARRRRLCTEASKLMLICNSNWEIQILLHVIVILPRTRLLLLNSYASVSMSIYIYYIYSKPFKQLFQINHYDEFEFYIIIITSFVCSPLLCVKELLFEQDLFGKKTALK